MGHGAWGVRHGTEVCWGWGGVGGQRTSWAHVENRETKTKQEKRLEKKLLRSCRAALDVFRCAKECTNYRKRDAGTALY